MTNYGGLSQHILQLQCIVLKYYFSHKQYDFFVCLFS